MATRASVPPTLMRRTPMPARSSTVKPNAPLLRKLIGFGATALHGRLDLLARLDAGRVEAIGAGVGESLQPADCLVEIGPAPDEAFGARGEHHVAAGFVDCRARRLDAGEREIEIVERIGLIAGVVLDR